MSSRRRHPIRQLRDALSAVRGERVTQATFAEMVGVSASLINGLETRTSRVLSDDLRERIAMRFGVHIEDQRQPAVTCLIFPKLPLTDALRKYQDEQPAIESGALRQFDERLVATLRAALLAAHKKNKAVIFLDQLETKMHDILDDLGVIGKFPEAKREISANRGLFPPHLTQDNLAQIVTHFQAARTRNASSRRISGAGASKK